MPNAETTFVDRHARGVTLHTTIAAFVPPFAPSNERLQTTQFATLLDDAKNANSQASAAVDAYSAKVAQRTDLATASKQRATRVLAQVRSNPNWKTHREPVERHVAKMSSQRLSRPKPPAEGEAPESEAKEKRNQGERGHAEMAQHVRNIASALAKIPNYTVPSEDLSVSAIDALATTYDSLNREMAALEVDLDRKRTARKALYDGETGLKETMKSIKDAVKAQYGTKSAQYLEARSVRL